MFKTLEGMMEMNTAVGTYIVYLGISVALTLWVGRTLYKNGALFLVDVFGGNAELAKAVNHLLVVGFYLVNLGYVSFALKMNKVPDSLQGSFESLSVKLGGVLLMLGFLHLSNVYIFNRFRQHARFEASWERPVTPDTTLATAPYGDE